MGASAQGTPAHLAPPALNRYSSQAGSQASPSSMVNDQASPSSIGHNFWRFQSSFCSFFKLQCTFPSTEAKYTFIFCVLSIVFTTLGGEHGGNNSGQCPWTLPKSQHSPLVLCTQRELIKENRVRERKLVLGQMESFTGKAGNLEGRDRDRPAEVRLSRVCPPRFGSRVSSTPCMVSLPLEGNQSQNSK